MTNNPDGTQPEPATWPALLWSELDYRPPEEQFVTTGEWIAYIIQTLLPELGVRRREAVLELLDTDGATAASVASQLGVRRPTLTRLIDEARSARKHQRDGVRTVEQVPADLAA